MQGKHTKLVSIKNDKPLLEKSTTGFKIWENDTSYKFCDGKQTAWLYFTGFHTQSDQEKGALVIQEVQKQLHFAQVKAVAEIEMSSQ